MAAESLREELMGLAGVAEVDVDEADDSPSGVRVRLEADADARLVGVEVQRVLAAHGLRSRITAQDEPGPEPEVAPEPDRVPEPVAPTSPPPIIEPVPFPAPFIPPPPLTPPPTAPVPEAVPARPVAAAGGSGLASVSVEESSGGVSVTAAAADGRTITQRGEATEKGMFEAVIAAVGILAEGSQPSLISITPIEAGGAQAIAVVLERADGRKAAGAAIVKVGAGYAVGRATWSALQGS